MDWLRTSTTRALCALGRSYVDLLADRLRINVHVVLISLSRLLLIGAERNSHTDNLHRLERAFRSNGWEVTTVSHDELTLDRGNLQYFSNRREVTDVDAFDVIWVLGFGSRSTFLDRMQLLHAVNQNKFVNSIDAYLLYHNKATLAMSRLNKYSPSTIVSADVEVLVNHVRQGGHWIAKPTAGSFGRDVFELTVDDPNLEQILEHLTRNDYAILQERVDTVREQRWFVAMGTEIGAYQKVKDGLRGNIRATSSAVICEPDEQEREMVRSIARDLVVLGIRACAVDIAYPYLLDVNFVNPGWFQTMEHLTGVNLANRLPSLFEGTFR